MEPSRVELLSKLGIDLPIIHRLSPFDPRTGTIFYPRWWDALVKVLVIKLTREKLNNASVGVNL